MHMKYLLNIRSVIAVLRCWSYFKFEREILNTENYIATKIMVELGSLKIRESLLMNKST